MEQINCEKRLQASRQMNIPGGRVSNLYKDMSEQNHLLIAGMTGSGKSVVLNGIIHAILARKSFLDACLILIDPKGIELAQWKNTASCIYYAQTDAEIDEVFQDTVNLIDKRLKNMQATGEKTCSKASVYVMIDELACIGNNLKTSIFLKLQKICQNGRLAKVHVIATTQCPIAKVIPTVIKSNFDALLGLHTRSAQDSRNIVGVNGCELLPPYGKGMYIKPGDKFVAIIPQIPDEDIRKVIQYWSDPVNYSFL